jgi:acetylornithine deacetylase/succinyl-diaminopimelate desuccinylase-like protein
MPVARRSFLTSIAAALLTAPPRLHAAAQGNKALEPVYACVDAGLEESVARIQRWIRQPSVSTQNLGVSECCELTMQLLREAGFTSVRKLPTERHPGILATLDVGAPRTLGLYFMYDVQPVVPSEWASPPWAAALLDRPDVGKVIMGRGAENQKGPQGAFLSALHAIRAAGRKLPVNLVLLAEGEEELGSPHLGALIERLEVTQALRRTQGLIMPSASQSLDGSVGVALGAKGLVYLELEASGKRWGRGPQAFEIHSGNKSAVDSPVWRLVQALATLVSQDGNEPRIDGLEAPMRPVSAQERKLFDAQAARFDGEAWKREMQVARWIGDLDKRSLLERMQTQPTVNIDGLQAGYSGEGIKTILPHRAVAKLDLRIVPDMRAQKVAEQVRAHLDRRGYSDIEMRVLAAYDPVQVPAESPLIRAYLAQLQQAGLDPEVWLRSLGSFPGYLFTRPPIERPITRVGLGCGGGAHSKDEFLVVTPAAGKKFVGLAGAIRFFVDYLYAFATA